MYFNAVTKVGQETVQRLLNSSSWSSCLSYMEGTGENLQSISIISSNNTIIVNNVSSTTCYVITLKDNITDANSTFILVDDSYSSVQNWLSQQTNKSPILFQQQEKSYITV